MDMKSILTNYEQKYARLTKETNETTIEGHTYREISQIFEQTKDAPAETRCVAVLAHLRDLQWRFKEEKAQKLTATCYEDYKRDTGMQLSSY